MTQERFLRVSILFNPGAGSAAEEKLAALVAERPGWCVELTDSPEDLHERVGRVIESGAEVVVAAGGDGTIHTVAQAIADSGSDAVMGVLPFGTANDFARSLGLDGLESAADALVLGETRRLDVIRVHFDDGTRRSFVNVASGGLAPRIGEALDDETKSRWGVLAYARGALEVAGEAIVYDVRVQCDDEPAIAVRAVGAAFANGRMCGGGMNVAPTADLEDGLLDVVLLEESSVAALATLAARMKMGEVEVDEHLVRARGREIVFQSTPPMPFVFDGELLESDSPPTRFELLPSAIEVIVGPAYSREASLG